MSAPAPVAAPDVAAREDACARVLKCLQADGIEQLRIVWADLHGTLRGKTLVVPGPDRAPAWATTSATTFTSTLRDGLGIVSTLLMKDTADRTVFKVFEPGALDALPGLAGANNLLLRPDLESCLPLPWAPGVAWMRAEPLLPDGRPAPADPRRVLQQALAELSSRRGLALRCGLEVEFHVFRIEGEGGAAASAGAFAGADAAAMAVRGAITGGVGVGGSTGGGADTGGRGDAGWPAAPPALRHIHPGYKLLADDLADLAHEPLAIVRRTALGLGLPLVSLEIELGPSQVEAVFAPTDALTAADHLVLFRNGVRQALRRAGYHATFMCRPPLPHAVASGWHLHQSLVDAHGGNAMRRERPGGAAADPADARQVLSDTGAHWLAGLLAHARGLAAISAPTVGGCVRYRGSIMAPQSAVWGRDNRGAMLRVVGGTGDAGTRIENRLGEPMANPYLTMAAQIHAGLHGLRERLEPGPASSTPYDQRGTPLPSTLGEALDALAADPVLMQGLGPAMAAVFLAAKRQELSRHAQAEDAADWERREYLARY